MSKAATVINTAGEVLRPQDTNQYIILVVGIVMILIVGLLCVISFFIFKFLKTFNKKPESTPTALNLSDIQTTIKVFEARVDEKEKAEEKRQAKQESDSTTWRKEIRDDLDKIFDLIRGINEKSKG